MHGSCNRIFSYVTDIDPTELTRIAQVQCPGSERTIVYNSANGTDYIHLGVDSKWVNEPVVVMTVLDHEDHADSARAYLGGLLKRPIGILGSVMR